MFSYIFQTLTESSATVATQASWRVQVSGVMGSTSLACWIVLLMPQLIEQWRLKSAEGIAIGFISIWFVGDILNLIGSLWAGLLPEVIFLAVWFCIADFLMIFSYFYYTKIYPKRHAQHHHHHHGHKKNKRSSSSHAETPEDEESPLLTTTRSRRSSTLTDIAMEPEYHSIFIKYVLPILFVIGCGLLGFFVSDPASDDGEIPGDSGDDKIILGPQILGYLSAFLYLGARIPQIVQNHKRKSVHGLSLLFFLFSSMGNLTYAGQILFFRSDAQYITLNMSWLLGSLGTILEDSFIILQFYIYREKYADSPLEITP